MNSPLRVFMIDDNQDHCILVLRELRREFSVLQAEQITDADAFVRALDTGGFDMVITEFQLRWTDGLEAPANETAPGPWF